MYKYKYPRPALTTDSLIFGYDKKKNKLKILFIKRLNKPFKDKWALPGGFVDMNETVEKCAIRELEEETGLKNINLEQLIVASEPDRDPRGRTVSVVFWAITQIQYNAKGQDDAKDAKWFDILNLPELGFDHNEIVNYAIKKIKFRLKTYQYFKNFFAHKTISENINEIKKIVND